MGCAIINAAGGQPLPVMRPSVDMAVQYKPALSSQMTRRAMMAGTVGLGVTASNRAAVADPGTPDFRPKPLGIKQEIAGIPKQNLFGDQGKYARGAFKTEEVGDSVAPNTEGEVSPGFLPGVAVFSGVFLRINELLEKAQKRR